jgi:hypothetical protein
MRIEPFDTKRITKDQHQIDICLTILPNRDMFYFDLPITEIMYSARKFKTE